MAALTEHKDLNTPTQAVQPNLMQCA